MAKLAPYMLEDELENVRAAYEFSKYGHRNNPPRKTRERYFDHPRAAALIAIDEFHIYDWQIIVALLLHDILEDSWILSERRMQINFGRKVALWVKFATKGPNYQEWYIPRLRNQPEWQPLFIKLCDRLHNLRTIHGFDETRQEKYRVETNKDYNPARSFYLMSKTAKYFFGRVGE